MHVREKETRTARVDLPFCFFWSQADDAGLADTKDKEKAERTPVGPHHVLRWFGEVATHVKTQVDKVGLVNSLAPCGLVVSFCPFLLLATLLLFTCLEFRCSCATKCRFVVVRVGQSWLAGFVRFCRLLVVLADSCCAPITTQRSFVRCLSQPPDLKVAIVR